MAYWIFAALTYGQDSQIPPDILMVNGKHCTIEPRGKKWQGSCTASYLTHENFQREPYVVRFPQRNSEPRANKDVNDWLEKVNKIQAKTQPVSVNQLKKEK